MLPTDLMQEIVSDQVLDQAYDWLCKRRKHYSWNNDVWTLRFRWPKDKADLVEALVAGNYRFDSTRRIPDSPDDVELWSSRDALVLKAMAPPGIALHPGRRWAFTRLAVGYRAHWVGQIGALASRGRDGVQQHGVRQRIATRLAHRRYVPDLHRQFAWLSARRRRFGRPCDRAGN